MRLYDWSHDESNLIGIILYHNSFQNKPFINYLSLNLPNLLGQSFKSTYVINLFIKSVVLLACDISLFLTNICI